MALRPNRIRETADEQRAAKLKKKAEKRASRRYSSLAFGSMKTGYLIMKRDGRISYSGPKSASVTKFHADDVETASLEQGSELVRRPTVVRAGGGALAGGILLGPVGLLAGLGLGALAQKKEGGEQFVVLELKDGRVVFAQAPKNQMFQAKTLVRELGGTA